MLQIIKNHNLIVLLSICSAGLFTLNAVGVQWYIKQSSVADELFYIAVTCVLAIKDFYSPPIWSKNIYKYLLGANLAIGLINLIDAMMIMNIKCTYLFLNYSVQEFAEVEKMIDELNLYIYFNATVWMLVLSGVFGWLLCWGTDYLQKNRP